MKWGSRGLNWWAGRGREGANPPWKPYLEGPMDSNMRFKFVDDLTILEKICLMTVGIASFN